MRRYYFLFLDLVFQSDTCACRCNNHFQIKNGHFLSVLPKGFGTTADVHRTRPGPEQCQVERYPTAFPQTPEHWVQTLGALLRLPLYLSLHSFGKQALVFFIIRKSSLIIQFLYFFKKLFFEQLQKILSHASSIS